MIEQRPTLTLEDLERFDPGARGTGRERRFLCPLPGPCEAKQRATLHRSLSVNVETGAWHCWRCGAAGKLRERWEQRPPRRLPALARARRACRLNRAIASAPAPPPPVAGGRLQQGLRPLEGTPAARYLAGRGIPLELAMAAGALWAPNWYGRPAVVFALRDGAGQLVAMQGRHTDGDAPKMRDLGPKAQGVFATPGALEASRVVIVEAPIDALSLAVVGTPAAATCGCQLPSWLARALAFRDVAIGTDNDEPDRDGRRAGDEAATRWTVQLQACGVSVDRWRPPLKDWNEVLRQLGADALRQLIAEHQVDEPNGNEENAPVFTFEVRWASEAGWLEVRDVYSGEWHTMVARDCPPSWRDMAHRERAHRRVA